MNNRKHEKQIADLLNECFESMLAKGESLESCLRRYPGQAAELKPLLETMKAAREAGAISPDASFKAKAHYEFRSALYDDSSAKFRPSMSLRWVTVAASLGVFVLTGAGGAVAASSTSMPGQFLYQVKRNIEDVQLALTPSQAGKARLYASLADRRISEIVYSAESGDVQRTENLTRQFTGDLGMVYQITAAEHGQNYSGDSTLSAPAVSGSRPAETTSTSAASNGGKSTSPTSTTPSSVVTVTVTAAPPVSAPPVIAQTSVPAPTVIVTQQPTVTVTISVPSPAPIITMMQPSFTTANLSGITDPVLLKLLQKYSIKNVAELMAILDKVPPSTKAALLAALQAATSAYGQILVS